MKMPGYHKDKGRFLMNANVHLAIDIGASGGRHILGYQEGGILHLEEIHRFVNGMKSDGGSLCWDLDAIFDEIIIGLKKCALLDKKPVSVGIDTWGVDFVLLDKKGFRLGPSIAYRDCRTDGMDLEVYKCISDNELYERTGTQKMLLNTIFQLMAVLRKTPQYLDEAANLLMIPDYLHYRLCGVMKNEYTIASTSGLINARTKTWDDDIIARCGFPKGIFGDIVPAGSIIGRFTDEVKATVGYDCTVIMPPSHDTASAFLAVPAKSGRSVYISSGTWSLMGVELCEPITNPASKSAGFTNEGGYEDMYRYIKNIAGMWLIQSVYKEIGDGIDYTELVALARESDYDIIFDVNDETLTAPASMVSAISKVCLNSGGAAPDGLGDFARCIFRSLAASYANTIKDLQAITGTVYDSINIIGGASRNKYLNELCAEACQLPVYAGPAEGTALGNIASQMIAYGGLSGPDAVREAIGRSFHIHEVLS